MEQVIKTRQDAIEALRQVVEGREGFVYPGSSFGQCYNFVVGVDERGCPTREPEGAHEFFDNGNYVPSCVVGHVLAVWDLPREQWIATEGGIASLNYCLDNRVGAPFVLHREAALVLRAAQVSQDGGKSWGISLGAAESVFATLESGGVVTDESIDQNFG